MDKGNKDGRALKAQHYPEIDYGGFSRVNAIIHFYSRVNALLRPDTVAVDVGCGRGAWMDGPIPYARELRNLKGKCAQVIGIDVSEGARLNESLDEFRLINPDAGRWPLDDGSVDLLVSDSVLEHIADPSLFFSECQRVLKVGGLACIRTFNVWHYNGLASYLIPERFHEKALRFAQPHRREADIFPTYYRCNSLGRLRSAVRKIGWHGCVYGHEGEPAYLSWSPISFWIGVRLQRFAIQRLSWNLFVFARKPMV